MLLTVEDSSILSAASGSLVDVARPKVRYRHLLISLAAPNPHSTNRLLSLRPCVIHMSCSAYFDVVAAGHAQVAKRVTYPPRVPCVQWAEIFSCITSGKTLGHIVETKQQLLIQVATRVARQPEGRAFSWKRVGLERLRKTSSVVRQFATSQRVLTDLRPANDNPRVSVNRPERIVTQPASAEMKPTPVL